MANKKITDLTNLQTPVANSEFVVVDIQNDETKSITFANLNVAIQTNTGVTAGLYGGVVGTETNVAAITVGADGRITSASNVTVQVDLPTLEGNVNTVSSNVELVGANTKGLSSVGHTITSTANIHPGANNTYTLGAADAVFSEVYIGPNSLKLGSLTISDTGGETLTITGASGQKGNISTASVSGVANLTSNVITLETDLIALEARRAANNTLFSDEDTALQSRLTTNVTLLTNEDTALQARITANNTLSHSNDFITFTRLNANLDVIQDNVAAIIDGTTNFSGEVTMGDDLIVTGNLIVNGTTTTINTTNLDVDDTLLMLANGTTGSPANDVGILFNRGAEGNAAFYYDESSVTFKISDTRDPKSNTSLSPITSSNLDVGILTAATVKFDGTDLNTAISDNVTTLTNEDTALQSRLATNVTAFTNEDTALQARLTTNVTAFTNEDTALQVRIAANNTLITELETRRTQNIAGAVSSITTSDLALSRALVSDGSGKVSVSDITSTELAFLDGLDQNLNSNLEALAAGIQGIAVSTSAPTGDYGLLDAANTTSTDAFGEVVSQGLTIFDMRKSPASSLNTQDLGALT